MDRIRSVKAGEIWQVAEKGCGTENFLLVDGFRGVIGVVGIGICVVCIEPKRGSLGRLGRVDWCEDCRIWIEYFDSHGGQVQVRDVTSRSLVNNHTHTRASFALPL